MCEREFITAYQRLLESERARLRPQDRQGNVAVLAAQRGGEVIYFKTAFSTRSLLGGEALESIVDSIPDHEWRKHLVGVVPNPQNANHTEPKLFVDFVKAVRQQGLDPDSIVLASERECCPTCIQHTIKALVAIDALWELAGDPLPIVIVEAWWGNGQGRILKAGNLRPFRK
jgi:hypothetical protein